MKKFYSLVLMATALLLGTNAMADVTTWGDLKTAMQAGGTVTLGSNIETTVTSSTWADAIWIGAVAEDGEAPQTVLNLNGHNITINMNVNAPINPFVISKGSLAVTSATPATIKVVKGTQEVNRSTNVFFVFGTGAANASYDPKGNNPFSHLTIGANVTVSTENGSALVVDQLTADHATIKNLPAKPGYTAVGYAFGARVDVEGTLTSSGSAATEVKCYGIKTNGNLKTPAEADKAYAPYVWVHPSAVVKSDMRSGLLGAAAIYASGFAQWKIEGTCDGATGVYISSGSVEINDATISSAADSYNAPGATGHANGSGSAIVVNSRENYPGDVSVTVSGDTKASSTSGYAMEEIVNATTTKVDSITIEGGSFEGGDKGAITISEKTGSSTSETVVTVAGGNVSGSANVGTETLAEYLSDQGGTHATIVTDPETGKTTLVISEGDAPTGQTTVSGQTGSVEWKSATVSDDPMTDEIATNLVLDELVINDTMTWNGTKTRAKAQTLTVKAGAKLTVGRVVMGTAAQIVVEAGATFIVTGEQGITAPVASNILLKASEDAQAIFLFNPAVTSNRHPNAKVEYKSNSFYSDHNVQQFFGIPTYNGAVTNIETSSTAKIYFDVWRNTAWDYIGALNAPGEPDVMANLAKFNAPFGLYCITSKNDIDHKPTFTFSGELTGNMDHTFTLLQGWTTIANAYMGPIDKNAVIAQLATWNAKYGTEQNVYTYDLNASTGEIQWHARNKFQLPETGINAMQPILFHNANKVDGVDLDYAALVWDPFVAPVATPAPARNAISNITKAQINIAGENEVDYTTIVMDSELGDDRSFCAAKYDNAGLQLYVMGNEKFDIYAADEIENSYIGYRTVSAGMYTISFENVQGEELVLIDLVNGNRTSMTEGAIYTFHAEANESNDYRFQVVAAAKMPTAIENAEAVKSAKGIYTITGQYMGEMNVWNSLPAGVYVVNGEKLVK